MEIKLAGYVILISMKHDLIFQVRKELTEGTDRVLFRIEDEQTLITLLTITVD